MKLPREINLTEDTFMKVNKVILSVGITAGVLAAAAMTQPALAWHPKGEIVKKVQNITTGSVLSDADTASTGVAAKPGDVLKYVITVSNKGAKASNGDNDMVKTIVADLLPDGVELTSSPSTRAISANLGRIKPGEAKTKEFTVKVVAKTSGTIENTACFTGDSGANDNPQKGCNPAFVNVTVPETPAPVTPEKPEQPKPPVKETPAPVELPHTGPVANAIFSVLALGGIWYAIHRYVTSERELADAWIVKK